MGACLSQSEEAQLEDKDDTLDQAHPSCLERKEQEWKEIHNHLYQECIRMGATRVKACNYIKIKTGRNFPPVLKIVTHTAQAA